MKQRITMRIGYVLKGLLPVVLAVTAGAQTAQSKPTIVLVHGAFADAASWSGIIDRPQKRGTTPLAGAFAHSRSHSTVSSKRAEVQGLG